MAMTGTEREDPSFADAEAVVERLSPEDPAYCLCPGELHRAARAFLDGFPGDVLFANWGASIDQAIWTLEP